MLLLTSVELNCLLLNLKDLLSTNEEILLSLILTLLNNLLVDNETMIDCYYSLDIFSNIVKILERNSHKPEIINPCLSLMINHLKLRVDSNVT